MEATVQNGVLKPALMNGCKAYNWQMDDESTLIAVVIKTENNEKC